MCVKIRTTLKKAVHSKNAVQITNTKKSLGKQYIT